MKLRVNGSVHTVPGEWQAESLLFFLRGQLGLVGAKFGCGVGDCGACTVIVDGEAVRSCQLPVDGLEGAAIRTVEGLAAPSGALHPVQKAWLDEAVPQCGYCQAGQIMSAVALLEQNPNPGDPEIEAAMDGNLCRCGTYRRIRRAIHQAAEAQS